MSIVFRAGNPNFPANQTELKMRLAEIEQLINKKVPQVNIKFSEAAFKLMEDCSLITESNLKLLCSAQACESIDSNFKFPFNLDEGALRSTNDNNDVLGADGCPRFYNGKKRRIESNGQIFLFSNDWYSDYNPYKNKRAFYNWLAEKAKDACEKHWVEQNHSKDSETIDPLNDFDIGDIDFEEMDFGNIDLENIESENVDKFRCSISIDSYIGSAEQVTIPAQIDGLPVTSIGKFAFRGCESLTKITIPDGVISIGDRAFSWCTNLKSIVISDSVTSIDDEAFSWCTNLESIVIPDSVISMGEGVFGCCTNLESIIITNSVTSIGALTFESCEKLKSIIIPDSVTFIGELAFWGCKSLTEITIPDSVMFIDNGAFDGCGHLEKIYIGQSALSRESVKHVIYEILGKSPSCKILLIPKK